MILSECVALADFLILTHQGTTTILVIGCHGDQQADEGKFDPAYLT